VSHENRGDVPSQLRDDTFRRQEVPSIGVVRAATADVTSLVCRRKQVQFPEVNHPLYAVALCEGVLRRGLEVFRWHLTAELERGGKVSHENRGDVPSQLRDDTFRRQEVPSIGVVRAATADVTSLVCRRKQVQFPEASCPSTWAGGVLRRPTIREKSSGLFRRITKTVAVGYRLTYRGNKNPRFIRRFWELIKKTLLCSAKKYVMNNLTIPLKFDLGQFL